MTITVYTGFSKRKNSTKQPTGGTQKTVTLKEGTSIESPTFVLQSNDFTINYVKAFDHYYFVDDIKSVRNNLIEISCSLDVGATFKSAITSYTAFVERSYTYHNPKLADPYVSIFNAETVYTSTTAMSAIFNSTGYYVLSVLNDVGSGEGFMCYYIMDYTTLKYIADYCSTSWDAAATDFITWLQSTFLKTYESIIDCKWIPFGIASIPSGAGSLEVIKIGVTNITGGHTAYRITQPAVATTSITVAIPGTYTDFRRGAPYTTGKINIPGYGMVDFNPIDFTGDKIKLQFDVDIVTGDVCCYLKDTNDCVVAVYTYGIAVNCPVGKVGADASGALGGILSTAGSIASAVATKGVAQMAAGIGATASGINTLASAVAPTVSVKGGQGGRAISKNGLDIIITVIEKVTSDPDELLETQGRAWMRESTMASFSGYVKCSGADVPMTGMASDKEAVNNLLNNGFYLE